MPYRAHLIKDKKLKKIIDINNPIELKKQKNICIAICRSVIGQQLSTKVAAVIFQRFLNLFGGRTPQPEQVVLINIEALRSIGLSYAKAGYVHNVCKFWLDNKLSDAKLHKMNNDELIDLLVQIKGIGKWSAEMIMMFSLCREDVFSVDDLGIQKAMCKLYGIDGSNKKEMKAAMLEQSKKWIPYRTYACLHLWQWKDSQ